MDKISSANVGFARGWKGIGVISGSCRAGNGYPDSFYTSFTSAFYRLTTIRLLTAVISPNDGPATGAICVSGRATSGSGLVANPVLSE